jgi:hypothetical protein
MGSTHSGKPLKSLEKPGFPDIPRKFSSLIVMDNKRKGDSFRLIENLGSQKDIGKLGSTRSPLEGLESILT